MMNEKQHVTKAFIKLYLDFGGSDLSLIIMENVSSGTAWDHQWNKEKKTGNMDIYHSNYELYWAVIYKFIG